MKKSIWAFLAGILLLIAGASYAVTNDTASQILTDVDAVAVQPADSDAAQSKKTDNKTQTDKASLSATAAASAPVSDNTSSAVSDLNLKPVQVSPAGNSGAAITSIPIEVPPGRKGMQPNISLNYNSGGQNGWLGVGWSFDMGAIQRNTKRGVDYNGDDFVVTVNGSSSELIYIGFSPEGYREYRAKIEGAFSRYYKISDSAGWEVTTKDGTKYYYGTIAASRQDSALGIFKWCLDKVQDTNGNYMTVSYTKDQGEIYLDRLDNTGNTAGLSTTNYVKFYLEGRTDAPVMFNTNAPVKTAYRLKTIKVVSNGSMVRAYKLIYDADPNTTGYQYSSATGRSLLYSIQLFGTDAVLDSSGTITSGSSLPSVKLLWSNSNNNFDHNSRFYDNRGYYGYSGAAFADVTGDGKKDAIFWNPATGDLNVIPSNGSGFDHNSRFYDNRGYYGYSGAAFADVTGDGKADAIFWNPATGDLNVIPSNGSGFDHNSRFYDNRGYYGYSGAAFADVTGDGKADAIFWNPATGDLNVIPSNGSGFDHNSRFYDNRGYYGYAKAAFADVTGDGKADAIFWNPATGDLYVIPSNGSGFDHNSRFYDNRGYYGYSKASFADVTGDGKADAIFWNPATGDLYVIPSNGSGFDHNSRFYDNRGYYGYSKASFADVTGDGKADAIFWNPATKDLYIIPSNGSGFDHNSRVYHNQVYFGYSRSAFTDVTGDGKADAIFWEPATDDLYVIPASIPMPDLLTSVANGIGGSTTLVYKSSSAYDNCFDINGKDTCLPFVIQTLSKVTVNDGNAVSSETNYTYAYGYFDYADREFRGFQYVKVTAPDGTTSETSFHQDNIFKGFGYYQAIKDSSGNKYTETYNTYESTSPYTGVNFPSLSQKDDYIYDGTVTAKHATTSFEYNDPYGNITRKYLFGDVAITGDERDEYTEYTYDTTKWIVSLPSHKYINDSGGITRAQSWFTHDTKGNLLTKTDWLNGGTNPVTTYTYDPYGNISTIKDARNNTSTISYDSTYTYPVQMTNPLGHVVTKTYDARFGKVLTDKDSNNNITTYAYDVFGRIVKVTNPNDTGSTYGTVSYYYLNFGTVGSQKVVAYATEQSGTGNYIWTETYFDGLGRTIKTRSEGPDNKVVVTQTQYNNRGLINSEPLPYFEGLGSVWRTYQYDPIGRITRTDNPDTTYATSSYLKGTLTYIDPKGNKKVEEKDIYGRVIKIEEYTGVSPSFSLYATTRYESDVLGNLKKVTDAQNNQTVMNYDTLSRKISMTDPDMGYWTYQYDANGNLISQTDAKNQTITFTYDSLNRITKKDYPTGTDVVYTYDEIFSTYPKGRLTTVTDASGTAKFYYDKLGRTIKTIKTVDSVNYTTETSFDALGRTDTLKYPDNTILKYEYDTGGNLLRVKNNSTGLVYASYINYNAVGQIGRTDFGNGVNTIYQYLSLNNRLYSITTSKQSTDFINLSYAYDNVGNITGITDYLDSTKTRTYGYDDLNRLTSATSASYGGTLTWQYNQIGNMTYNSRYGNYVYGDSLHKHAVTQAGADTYTYDPNGNMKVGAGRTIDYDYDNRATSIVKAGAATISVYDAGGQRVKKVIPGATTIYIGKLYECTNGVCTKYIFGGSDRIVSIAGASTRYYHTDHLGSSSVITDQNGISVQALYYYPYGEIQSNIGTDVARYKFTGQEWDAETGLYYYGARYYDPKLGRFISADTIVPEPFNPQALNRYSYVLNNPLKYIDPTGHGFWNSVLGVVEVIVGFVVAIVGAVYENNYVCAAGIAIMGDGVGRLGGNVNEGAGVSTDSGGNTSSFGYNPDTGERYSLSGSEGGGSSGTGGAYGEGNGGTGGSGNGFYATDGNSSTMTFYLRIEDHQYNVNTIRNTINSDMHPSRSNISKSSEVVKTTNDSVEGLKFFCNCMANDMLGGIPWGEAAGTSYRSYINYQAWKHAVTTPSKTYGTPFLVSPMKSSIVRNSLRWGERATQAGIALDLGMSIYKCLREEYNYYAE